MRIMEIDKVIEIQGKKALLLDASIEKNILPEANLADIWIINSAKISKAKKFMRKIARSMDPRIYLKPVFLQKELKNDYHKDSEFIKEMCDGYIENLDISKKHALIDRVDYFLQNACREKISKLYNEDEVYKQKIFDYYYTRNKKIKPIRTVHSVTSYSYPRVCNFFLTLEDAYKRSRMILRDMHLNGYLTREYVDTLHLCSKCNSGFLNYREVCPKCKSHNLRVESLIHHFRCAYVGSESDFTYDNKLICPKCSSQLRNLGVDYDRPGNVYICKNKTCHHEFQEAPVEVGCARCKSEQKVEDLLVKKVYNYEITEKAIAVFLKPK